MKLQSYKTKPESVTFCSNILNFRVEENEIILYYQKSNRLKLYVYKLNMLWNIKGALFCNSSNQNHYLFNNIYE